MAGAVIGSINELVLQAIEPGRAGRLQQLTGPAGQLVRSLTIAGLGLAIAAVPAHQRPGALTSARSATSIRSTCRSGLRFW